MSTCSISSESQTRWQALLGTLPGVLLVMLHSAMIDLPRADIVDALDSDRYRIQWISASYLLGGAAGLGLTRYLAGRVGLRYTCIGAVLLFSAAASVCGFASEVIVMTPFRLIQGLGAGLTLSGSMVLLWREFGERRALAMAVYGSSVFLAALAGPVVAGMLTYWVSWRLIFLMNAPLGPLAAWFAWRFLPRDYPSPVSCVRFDFLGLALFLLSIATLSVVVDMGQYWGWLRSPFFVPWLVTFIVFAVSFVLRGLVAVEPFIDLRLFRLRNYGLAIVLKAILSINLYVLLALLSAYMIDLRRYQWWQGAMVVLPAAVGFIGALAIGMNSGSEWKRLKMVLGFATMAIATWIASSVDLYSDKRWLAVVVGGWGVGAGLAIVPVMLTMFDGVNPTEVLHCAGIYNMMRLLPAAVTVTLFSTLLVQRSDAHFDRLRQDITYNRPLVSHTSMHLARHFADRGSSSQVAQKRSHATLGRWTHANARAYALQNSLWYLALAPAAAVGLVLLVRRSP